MCCCVSVLGKAAATSRRSSTGPSAGFEVAGLRRRADRIRASTSSAAASRLTTWLPAPATRWSGSPRARPAVLAQASHRAQAAVLKPARREALPPRLGARTAPRAHERNRQAATAWAETSAAPPEVELLRADRRAGAARWAGRAHASGALGRADGSSQTALGHGELHAHGGRGAVASRPPRRPLPARTPTRCRWVPRASPRGARRRRRVAASAGSKGCQGWHRTSRTRSFFNQYLAATTSAHRQPVAPDQGDLTWPRYLQYALAKALSAQRGGRTADARRGAATPPRRTPRRANWPELGDRHRAAARPPARCWCRSQRRTASSAGAASAKASCSRSAAPATSAISTDRRSAGSATTNTVHTSPAQQRPVPPPQAALGARRSERVAVCRSVRLTEATTTIVTMNLAACLPCVFCAEQFRRRRRLYEVIREQTAGIRNTLAGRAMLNAEVEARRGEVGRRRGRPTRSRQSRADRLVRARRRQRGLLIGGKHHKRAVRQATQEAVVEPGQPAPGATRTSSRPPPRRQPGRRRSPRPGEMRRTPPAAETIRRDEGGGRQRGRRRVQAQLLDGRPRRRVRR